jgi:hypothetical protein
MPGFTVQFKTETNHKHEFVINQIITQDGECYYITVKDENSKSHFFTMKEADGNWRIVTPLAVDWILELEKDLSKAILEKRSVLNEKKRIF